MNILHTVDVMVRLKVLTEDFTIKLTNVVNELDYTFTAGTAGAAVEDAEILSCEIVSREDRRK